MVCLSFTRGVGLVFFGWFACWPCMWGLVRCWWSLCSGCCLPLLLGGKAFAFFPVFPGFCRACPVGLGYSVFHLFWGPLASCIVLGYLLGFSLLEINSYLSKKKKTHRTKCRNPRLGNEDNFRKEEGVTAIDHNIILYTLHHSA